MHVNKNAVGKAISDPNLTAEKLAVFDVIEDIVSNAEYVGSGKYVKHSTKQKNVTRYDYFETDVTINGEPYLVTFDVEVVPGKNNYRTHKIINEISLMPLLSGEVGPVPTALKTEPSLFKNNIPQREENSNSNISKAAETEREEQEKIALANKIKEDLRIAEENEVEKTIAQQEKLSNIQKLVDDGIVPQEELETAKIKAEENIKEAENRQANLEYQNIDKDSGAVRQSIINDGKGKVIENIENFAAKKGYKVKYYSADADTAGNGFIEGDVIYLNVQDEKVMIKTAVHEIIHGLKGNNLENFDRMSREILNYAESNRHLLEVVENTIKAYTNPESIAYSSILDENGNISADKLSEEVLCKLCE